MMVWVVPTLLRSVCSSMNFQTRIKTFLVDDNDAFILRSSDVYFVEYDLKISRALLHRRAFTSLYFHRQENTSSKNRLRSSDILHNVDLMIVKYYMYMYLARNPILWPMMTFKNQLHWVSFILNMNFCFQSLNKIIWIK